MSEILDSWKDQLTCYPRRIPWNLQSNNSIPDVEISIMSKSKYTLGERTLIKNIVASLAIKKTSNNEIIKEIYQKTNKTVTRKEIYNVRQRIKKDSYQWFKTLREGQYEYIKEFKERIEELLWMQVKHHNIIDKNQNNPQLQQISLAELERMNKTLSNYYEVAPGIVNGITIPVTSDEQINHNWGKEYMIILW